MNSISSYNIPLDIAAKAEALGLQAIATGGGYDYIWHCDAGYGVESNDSPQMILADISGDGSPDNLESQSDILLWPNGEWQGCMTAFRFESAEIALVAMGDAGFRAAAFWVFLDCLNPDDHDIDSLLDEHYDFTLNQENEIAETDITRCMLSIKTLREFGATYAYRFSGIDTVSINLDPS